MSLMSVSITVRGIVGKLNYCTFFVMQIFKKNALDYYFLMLNIKDFSRSSATSQSIKNSIRHKAVV